MDKKSLSERDICTKFITPAIIKSGWDKEGCFREQVYFTDGKITVRKKLYSRGERKFADYILYYKENIPIAVIEAKDNNHSVGAGMQQALGYAEILDIPSVFSSNGDKFLYHDRTAHDASIEHEIELDEFPSPAILWEKYKAYKNIATSEEERVSSQDYFPDGSGRVPRYYQQIAINRSVEVIAQGRSRILLVMATGTGKTFVAFQIAYRLWKAKAKKRILFLADRNVLIDQARRNDFKHFQDKMTLVQNREVDKSYEVYLSLYQGISSPEEERNIYKQFSPNFFDLIIVDECHRGSAREDSAWREILEYFSSASQIGLTATPRETDEISNIEYFGEPLYTYTLRQGIDDGFLAPYSVLRVGIDIDLVGWRPENGKVDKDGNIVADRTYNRKDFDRNIAIDERTEIVARKITEFLKGFDRYAKTIVFCVDIEHAERMRQLLIQNNADLVANNEKYIMRITGDSDEGKRELDNFSDPDSTYPVIATTSELLTTGVDIQTCKVIVLDCNINSMTKFKQVIGRGTRIKEDYNKMFFTIIDFRNNTDLFADPDFDGDPIRVKEVSGDVDLSEDLIDEGEGTDGTDMPVEGGEPEPETGTQTEPPPPVEPRSKVFVNGVDVTILVSRYLYFNAQGKPVTKNLKDYTRELITGKYASLEDFLVRWNAADRKEAVIEELQNQGIPVDDLIESVEKQLDLFDLVCYVAYDRPPLTRRERANNVKKRDCFAKYGESARKVIDALIEKYADEGIENLESLEVLKVQPLTEYGSPMEIIHEFGGKEKYLEAIKELEVELYKSA